MSGRRAGERNKRIILQKIETARGPLGEVLPGEPVDASPVIFAGAEVISNRKIRTLDQQQVVETWLFTINPRPDVAIDWLIKWGSETFTIRAVDRSKPDRAVITAERDIRHD